MKPLRTRMTGLARQLFLSIIILACSVLIVWPIWIGSWMLTFDEDKGLSAQATIGLAVLAAALAAVVTWLYRSPTAQSASDTRSQKVTWLGRLFFFSALCLTLLAMLIPILRDIRVHPSKYDWWDALLRDVGFAAFILGTGSLTLGVVWGIYQLLLQVAVEKIYPSLLWLRLLLDNRRNLGNLGELLILGCPVGLILAVVYPHSVPWVVGGPILTFIMFFTGLCLIRRSNRGG